MILEITPSKPRVVTKKLTWKQELRQSLFKKNKQGIRRIGKNEQKLYNEAGRGFRHLFETQMITLKDKLQVATCHSYYSSYVPLKMQTKFDDQLTSTFPYIKHIYQKGRINDRMIILQQISEHMKNCKAKGQVESGWLQCLKKYICNIDSIRAAQIYLQLLKHGTSKLEQLHLKYGGQCSKLVFFQRISMSSNYFKKYVATNKSPFSVEIHEQINQISMPKTMKQLFCAICLTYDCNQHALSDQVKDRNYQYISPKNMRSDSQHLRKSIEICLTYRQLLQKGEVKGKQSCSSKCYKELNIKQWQSVNITQGKLSSPLVKGFIKIGIEMFSYSPCDISFLLKEYNVTCSHIFRFLLQSDNLVQKLQRKLMDSQAQMLTRQKKIESSYIGDIKKKKKLKIAHIQNSSLITSCSHYFRGQQAIDVNCEACSCRQRGYCIPQCMCSQDCPIRKRGCSCKKQDCRTKKCVCFCNNEQCDPFICVNCFGESPVKNNCNNHKILSCQFKKGKVGRSTIAGAGLGLFAAEPVKNGQLFMIYSGELIQHSIDLLRESLSVDNSFYNFGSPQGTIDARFMGNLSRYINHSDQGSDNLESQYILTQGRYKIGLYATRDIEKGEQLFFDYDGQGQLYKNYKDKYPFIKDKKKSKQ